MKYLITALVASLLSEFSLGFTSLQIPSSGRSVRSHRQSTTCNSVNPWKSPFSFISSGASPSPSKKLEEVDAVVVGSGISG